MAKKQFGKIITLAALAGAATAAISYLLKYKSFHKELDEDFRDFEDEFEEFGEADANNETTTRSYVSLNPDRQTETTEESAAQDLQNEEQESFTESIDDPAKDTIVKTGEAADLLKSAEVAVEEADLSNDSTIIIEDTTE